MKRTAIIVAVLSMALCAAAQSSGQPAQQTPPAAGQGAPAQGATPPAKHPPQAKTQPEFDAYNVVVKNTDPAAFEKAADDFASKFPDSELRALLYKNAMRLYQSANNGEKTEAMGRKVLSFDGDDPEALVLVAEVIAEKTRDTDLDKDQRYDEAVKMATKATSTVDTDINAPAGTPQDKLDAYKSLLRSNAYSIMGTIAYKKENYPVAEEDLQKSIDAYPAQPDPVVVLRLALCLDKQQKYPEALKVANRAVELTQDNTPIGTPARRERDRLQQLTGGTPSAQPPAQPPKN
ncbi:MAG: tetratricopeptide repeat protein [Acidobacteriia bacterium]|nr:tetratricopeptide repeat protein [Terriglobia bacterium]